MDGRLKPGETSKLVAGHWVGPDSLFRDKAKKPKKEKKDTTEIDAFHENTAALKDAISERESAYSEESANLKHQYDERWLISSKYIDDAKRSQARLVRRMRLLLLAAETLANDHAFDSKVIKQKRVRSKTREIEKETDKG